MEKTITLSIEEYNELLEYKKSFRNKTIIRNNIFGSYSYTESEFVEFAIKELEQIVSKVEEFNKSPWYKRIFYKFPIIL